MGGCRYLNWPSQVGPQSLGNRSCWWCFFLFSHCFLNFSVGVVACVKGQSDLFLFPSDIAVTLQCQKFCLSHKFLLLYWILIIFDILVNNLTLMHCLEVRSSLKIYLHVLSVTLILHLGRFSCFFQCCCNRRVFVHSEVLVTVSYVNISIMPLTKWQLTN